MDNMVKSLRTLVKARGLLWTAEYNSRVIKGYLAQTKMPRWWRAKFVKMARNAWDVVMG